MVEADWYYRSSKVVKKYLASIGFFILYILIINFAFVYFSPQIIPSLPKPLVNVLDPCYRTFIHTNFFKSERVPIFALGDSYVEGSGDEWLAEVKDYGFVRKLDQSDSFVVFGRGGFGNMSAVNEAVACSNFIKTHTSGELDFQDVETVVIGFYEGNDLSNNLWEFINLTWLSDFSRQRTGELFLPIVDIIREVPFLVGNEKTKMRSNLTGLNSIKNFGTVFQYVQAPALELDDDELKSALGITEQALSKLHEVFPNARIVVLYLSSPATLNKFDAPIKVQGYGGVEYFEASKAEILHHHEEIRASVSELCSLGPRCEMCDPTEALLRGVDSGLLVHGPRDWNHLNRNGYSIVSEELKKCLQ